MRHLFFYTLLLSRVAQAHQKMTQKLRNNITHIQTMVANEDIDAAMAMWEDAFTMMILIRSQPILHMKNALRMICSLIPIPRTHL
jgi:hypothetical protein